MPSNWAPSRRVVSKMSIDAGSPGASVGARSSAAASPMTPPSSADMLAPVLVAVDLAAHGLAVLLGDGRGHRARARDRPVVDRVHGADLGGGAAEEHLLGDVEVGADEVAFDHLEPEVA